MEWREGEWSNLLSFFLVFYRKCRIINVVYTKKGNDVMEHTVRKSKKNRVAIRIIATIFVLIAVARFVYLIIGEGSKNIIVTLFCIGCLLYGVNLMKQTLRPQAYDITYVFLDQSMTLKMHKKEKTISYAEITDLNYVVPSESLDYSIIQLYIGKEQYVIPFAENTNVGEALYGMLKLKKEEADAEQKEEVSE